MTQTNLSWNWGKTTIIDNFNLVQDSLNLTAGLNLSHLKIAPNQDGDVIIQIPDNQQNIILKGIKFESFQAQNIAINGVVQNDISSSLTSTKINISSAASVGNANATQNTVAVSNGGDFDDFLDNLLNFESGIDPANYANGIIGKPYIEQLVVKNAVSIGMNKENQDILSAKYNSFDKGELSARDMSYSSVNNLGFVGFQFGEALLIDLGYYKPLVENGVQKYYNPWKEQGSSFQHTSTNQWKGEFTGKDGVNNFADFIKPENQRLMMKAASEFNLNIVKQQLANAGKTIDDFLGKEIGGVKITMSGILASSHLVGSWGTASALLQGSSRVDENGTSNLKYMQKFGGFDTPFKANEFGDDNIETSNNQNLNNGQDNVDNTQDITSNVEGKQNTTQTEQNNQETTQNNAQTTNQANPQTNTQSTNQVTQASEQTMSGAEALKSISASGGLSQTNIQSFLNSLRAFESGTDINKTDWYLKNYKDGAVVTYAKLDENGKLYENKIIPEKGTIQTYFSKLHTAEIFEKAAQEKGIFDANNNLKPEALDANGNIKPELIESMKPIVHQMQYNVINPWGFVGYQLGEAVLVDAGIYSPQNTGLTNGTGEALLKYYMWTDGTAFGPGETAKFMKWNDSYTKLEVTTQENAKFIVTNSNEWNGKFTGKYGINSFQDLLDPAKQELAIREVMKFNLGVIKDILAKGGKTLGDVLNKEYQYSFKSYYTPNDLEALKAKDPTAKISIVKESYNGILKTYEVDVTTTVKVSMSGILAMAHLTGAWGAADTLLTGNFRVDETGTSNLKYLYDFGGHNTIFGSNVDDVLIGTDFTEEFTPGSGNNNITTGGGFDKIFVENDGGNGGKTIIKDFEIGKDKIIFKGFGPESSGKAIISEENGNAVVTLGKYSLVLSGISKSQLNANNDVNYSNGYKIGWSGKATISNFNPQTDKIEGTNGIDFKNLKIVQEGTNLKIGSVGADGGMYSWLELPGVKISDISPEMFSRVTGSFESMGKINIEAKLSWGYWSAQTPLENFDPTIDTIASASGGMEFSQITIKDTPAGAMISYGANADFGIVLKGVLASSLSAKNFFGFAGEFNNAKTIINGDIVKPIAETVNNIADSSNIASSSSSVVKDESTSKDNTANKTAETSSVSNSNTNATTQNSVASNNLATSNSNNNVTSNDATTAKTTSNTTESQNINDQNNKFVDSQSSQSSNLSNSQDNVVKALKSELKWWYGNDEIIENFDIKSSAIAGSGGMNLSQVKITDLSGKDAKITFGDSDKGIILKGIKAQDLGESNFSKFEAGNLAKIIINKEVSQDVAKSSTQIEEQNNNIANNNVVKNIIDNNASSKIFEVPQYKSYGIDGKVEKDLEIDFNPAKDILKLPFFSQVYKMSQTDKGVEISDIRYQENQPFVKILLKNVLAKDLNSDNVPTLSGDNISNIAGYQDSYKLSLNKDFETNNDPAMEDHEITQEISSYNSSNDSTDEAGDIISDANNIVDGDGDFNDDSSHHNN